MGTILSDPFCFMSLLFYGPSLATHDIVVHNKFYRITAALPIALVRSPKTEVIFVRTRINLNLSLFDARCCDKPPGIARGGDIELHMSRTFAQTHLAEMNFEFLTTT